MSDGIVSHREGIKIQDYGENDPYLAPCREPVPLMECLNKSSKVGFYTESTK